MMAAKAWQITNAGNAGVVATAAQAAPAGAAATNMVLRLRSLQASVEGTAAGLAQLVVRDGATGAGTIIWQQNFRIAANTGNQIEVNNLDLRATAGNALTVEFLAALGSAIQTVNAQGDMVPLGYSQGAN